MNVSHISDLHGVQTPQQTTDLCSCIVVVASTVRHILGQGLVRQGDGRCDQNPDLAAQHALVHRHLLHLANHLRLGILGSIHSDANWKVSYMYYWSDNDDLTFLMILEVIRVDVYFCILPTNCKHRQSFSFMKNISISLLLPSLDGVEWSPKVHGIKFRPRAIRIMHCILHWNCEHFQVISNTCLLVILLLIHYLQTQLMFVQNTA